MNPDDLDDAATDGFAVTLKGCTYRATGEAMDWAMVRHLPASRAELRAALVGETNDNGDVLDEATLLEVTSLSELLVIAADLTSPVWYNG